MFSKVIRCKSGINRGESKSLLMGINTNLYWVCDIPNTWYFNKKSGIAPLQGICTYPNKY